ncbi:TIGR04222 domain-containing membrane protein [Kitasatospora sp. NPDC088346]|uniref:TIGR04222 domain-containing membrane protein n=1 Tax=Kitasatospora sp. NPDC088346 TaxID=3364073 RepID=UPI00380AC27D
MQADRSRRDHPRTHPTNARLSLHELAFVAGGPTRVVDTTLLRMHREARLVVDTDTATATVADPHPADGIEAALIAAAGPELVCSVAELRLRLAGDPAIAALGRSRAVKRLLVHTPWGRVIGDCLGLVVVSLISLTLMAAAIACAGVALFSTVGETDGPVLGPLVATVVLVALLYGLHRLSVRVFNRPVDEPAERTRRVLDALAGGGAVPAPWRLAEDAWTSGGPTPLGAVALHGVDAVEDEAMAGALRGVPQAPPPPFLWDSANESDFACICGVHVRSPGHLCGEDDDLSDSPNEPGSTPG